MAKTNVKTAAKKEKGDVWYTLIAIFIAVCLLAGMLVAVGKPIGLVDYISMHTKTPYSTENFKVNNAMLQYLTYTAYNNYYSNIYNTYGQQSLSYFGLDNSKPMSKQPYYGNNTQTWLDVCVSEAGTNIKQVLILCEEATKAGKTLTEDDKAEIEENIQSIKDYASQNGVSFANAMYSMYGSKGITKSDLRKLMEMQYLASAYASEVTEAYTYTDEQYNNFYEENKLDYVMADYYSYTIEADYAETATDAEKTAAINAAKAKAKELLAKIDGGETFVNTIFEYETSLADEASEDDDEITKDTVTKSILKTQQTNKDSEADKWVFAETFAADGATKLIEGEEDATIYQIVKSAYREEYKSASLRELYVSLDDFDEGATAMKAYADSIIAAYNALSDKNGEAFSALAEQFTTDAITVTGSGLIEETTKTSTEGYENVNEWLFDESVRKNGDITTFEQTDEGIGIYFFESYGREVWLLKVDAQMRADDYETAYKALEEQYAVKENAKAISKIS